MTTLQERVHGTPRPEGWLLGKLHHALKVCKGNKNTGMKENNLLSLSYGRIIEKDIDTAEGLLPESFETYQVVEPGNIVMRLTDLQNDKRSLRQGLVNHRGIITSAYDALEVGKDHDPRFWAYALLALDLAKYYYSLGGGVRQSIKFADFPNDWIAHPDLETQKAIADFLDRETGRIDQLMEKKRRLAELLKEKRAALISHAVTKGLDPNAKMKPSGIEWLGDMPKHWGLLRAKYIFRIKKRIVGELGHDVLSVTQKGLKVKDTESGEGQLSMDYSKYQKVEVGDFVMNHMDLLTGWVDRATSQGVTSPDYRVFSLVNNSNDPEYFLALLQVGYSHKLFYAYGQGVSQLGRWRFSADAFNSFIYPAPPRLEQQAITLFLNKEKKRAIPLIEKISYSVEKLKEFRSSIITAAVTGQIDVTTWGKRGDTDRRLDAIEEEMGA